jgi:hypothetical protein
MMSLLVGLQVGEGL